MLASFKLSFPWRRAVTRHMVIWVSFGIVICQATQAFASGCMLFFVLLFNKFQYYYFVDYIQSEEASLFILELESSLLVCKIICFSLLKYLEYCFIDHIQLREACILIPWRFGHHSAHVRPSGMQKSFIFLLAKNLRFSFIRLHPAGTGGWLTCFGAILSLPSFDQ